MTRPGSCSASCGGRARHCGPDSARGLYRYAPDRDDPRWRWVSPGAIVATVLWLAGSAVFSIYTANFAQYNETYGSLGAVVVVMLWLFLTGFVVIFGAELNAEVERQTHKDSTDGRPQPLGRRQAYAADTVGETAEEVRRAKRPPGATKCGGRRARAPTHSPFRPEITVLDQ